MFSITKKICFPPTGRPVILARSAVKAHKEGVRNLGQSVGMSSGLAYTQIFLYTTVYT